MLENKEKILSIQFLRGIGAIMVVLCHTSFANGGTGVEIFLIISGFVAMYSTKNSVENYWIKRIIKIVPLYWLVTMVTGFFVYITPQLFRSYEVSLEYLMKSLLFIPYEHSGILQPLLGVGWTLNYEMFFYLIFWIVIKINHSKRGEIMVAVSVILVLINCLFELPLPFSFWMDGILLEFSYGIILFMLYEKYSGKVMIKSRRIATIVCWITALTGATCMELAVLTGISREISAGFVAWITIAIVLFCGQNASFPKAVLYIAEISYVLYLTHIYPVRLIETIIKCSDNYKMLLVVVSIIIAVLCAAAWNQVVEKKIQSWLKKKYC